MANGLQLEKVRLIKNANIRGKTKKDVDKGRGKVVRYTSAREERVLKGSRLKGARWTLKTIQKSKERRTTVN